MYIHFHSTVTGWHPPVYATEVVKLCGHASHRLKKRKLEKHKGTQFWTLLLLYPLCSNSSSFTASMLRAGSTEHLLHVDCQADLGSIINDHIQAKQS